jgi:hypothetical protein
MSIGRFRRLVFTVFAVLSILRRERSSAAMGTFFRQGDIKKPVKPVFHAESDRGGHLFITIS